MISIESPCIAPSTFVETLVHKKCKGFQNKNSVLNCKISKNFLLIFERGA